MATEISREEVIKTAQSRGWVIMSSSGDGAWLYMIHGIYNFGLELWPNDNRFKFTYSIDFFKFESGIASPFTTAEHYRKILKKMSKYCIELAYTKKDMEV